MLLATKNLSLNQPSCKLAKKYKGPFKVKKAIKNHRLAYKLALPLHACIHPVFPITVLELFRVREGKELQTPETIGYMEDKRYKVERILGH